MMFSILVAIGTGCSQRFISIAKCCWCARDGAIRSSGNRDAGWGTEILSGKRGLNVRQIKALAERFGINVSVFL